MAIGVRQRRRHRYLDWQRPANRLPAEEQAWIYSVHNPESKKAAITLVGKNIVSVDEMDETGAKDLLDKSLVDRDLLTDGQSTTDLLQKLTYLPLAIVQAAAFINENQITLSEYASLLDDTEQNRIDRLSKGFEDEGRYESSKSPIATT